MPRKCIGFAMALVVSISAMPLANESSGEPGGSPSVTGGLADSPWPMFRQNLNHTGLSPYDTSRNQGNLKWSYKTYHIVESSPAIGSDGTIYVGSADNYTYAINPDGSQKWRSWTSTVYQSSPAIDSDGAIYIGSVDFFGRDDSGLYAINPDGTEKWSFKVPDGIRTSPAIGSDGTIYVGSCDNRLYAINPDGTEKWSFGTYSHIHSSPAIGSDGTIYVGSTDGNLYAINPDGTEKWSLDVSMNAPFGVDYSSPAIASDGTIYIGSTRNNLDAVNPSGTRKWRFMTGGRVETSPAIGSDGTIYIGSYDNRVYAINPDGTEKWNFTTNGYVESSPAIGFDGTIFVGSNDNKFYAINPDGTEKWNFTTGDSVVSSPAIDSFGTIYVGSHDNNLYAIGPVLPDIVVSSEGIDFPFPPPAPKVGQLVGVKINATNKEDALAENFTLAVFEDIDGDLIPGLGENITLRHINGIGPLSYNISFATWIPMTAGTHTICAFADSLGNVTESNETNNVGCKDIEVLPGGVLTNLIVGQPNHVSDHTFITSDTPLTLQVTDLAGAGVAYTEYRVDNGDWMLYSNPFNFLDEGFYLLEYRSADPYGFLEPIKQDILAVDNTPPISDIAVGEPFYVSEDIWIGSSTPLTITADEPALDTSVVEEIRGMEVYHEPQDEEEETFIEYLARSNHTVSREIWPGLESVTFHVWGPCLDIDIGVFYDVNRDGERQVSEIVDQDSDPDSDETVTIESPNPGPYILVIAGFDVQPGGCLVDVDITQEFGWEASSGLAGIQYRIWSKGQWSDWSDYATSFSVLDEGAAYVTFFAVDNLGNAEVVHNRTFIVDDTPPRSTGQAFARTDGGYDILITFQDDGCGVDISNYRFVGDEQWASSTLLELSLNITSPGNYTIEYYAIDNLWNVENVKSLTVVIKAAPPPPTDNWKPLVAATFAIVLVLVGLWLSKRRPWKDEKGIKAILKTFALVSIPFVVAEILTGVVSSLTGFLSIPPAFGAGTLVDLAILLSGTLVPVYYSRESPEQTKAQHQGQRQNDD